MTAETKSNVIEIGFYISLIAVPALVILWAYKNKQKTSNDEGYEEIGRAVGASEDPGASGNPSSTVEHWSSGKQINAPAEPDHWVTQS
jgi:hypothetical protein